MNSLVILNPKAAGGRAAKLEPIIRAQLQALNVTTPLHISQDIEEARALISSLPHESRVILIGGDGSLHQMLPAVLHGRHELALVPYGSGNDTARAMRLLGMKPEAALRHALQAKAQPVDIGLIETTDPLQGVVPFISSMEAGFDAAIAIRAHQSPKWLRGLPRYLYATLLELHALRLNQISLTVDGKPMSQAPLLFTSVLNTPTFGSGMPAVPHARVDDGALDLLMAGQFSKLGAALMLPRLLAGKHLTHPRVSTQAFQHLSIESPSPLPLASDGEPLLAARKIDVRIAKGALKFVSA